MSNQRRFWSYGQKPGWNPNHWWILEFHSSQLILYCVWKYKIDLDLATKINSLCMAKQVSVPIIVALDKNFRYFTHLSHFWELKITVSSHQVENQLNWIWKWEMTSKLPMVSSFVALVLFIGSAHCLSASSYLIVGGIENWRENNKRHF